MANSKSIIKNCTTCVYSERDIKDLSLYCTILPHHITKIKNTWQDGEKCGCWTSAAENDKLIKQLKLF